ncbi:uncharacterized protein si:ch211-250c4.3 isoform X2 [Lates calcarifer]|uniref:Uncharacterized protein si:ch211-250c4.3 isoform X2 n=1 Tax=Lates calcarifer TaxID=8187 RepID=A0AAJ7Q8D7_LATCA|nr:uncharacterized protein si:ch211-250c4.3 isoform X2 [Lates calcarifer]
MQGNTAHLKFPQLLGLLQQHECEEEKGWACHQLEVNVYPGSLEKSNNNPNLGNLLIKKTFPLHLPHHHIRRGKGDRDSLLDSEVVLTKIKLFSNFHEKLLMSRDSAPTVSMVTASEQDILDLTKASEVNSHVDNKSRHSQMETCSDYLPAIFSDSQLQRLYKFESEDSGVELPSGANSPSTPTGSEQSFVVHSRESSCESCNLTSVSTILPDKLVRQTQSVESVDNSLSTTVHNQDNVFIHSEELCSSAVTVELHVGKNVGRNQNGASESSREGNEDMSEQLEENRAVTERTCSEDIRPGKQSSTGTCDNMTDNDFELQPIAIRSTTSDSLEEYMDECCRLSEAQQASSSPLSSGLDYLKHICQLIEKISQLQDTNLQLQRQICSLKTDSRLTKTKEHCSCGAASLTFQHVQKRHSRGGFLLPSGTLSDLSTIPEVTQHPLIPARRDMRSDSLTPVSLWRKVLNRRSYTEGEVRFAGDSTEWLSIPQHRLSENYTWGPVKDLVRTTKLGNQSRLGLTSASLKMSCPQLYRPDLGPIDPAGRNSSSMIVLGHKSKLDFPWLQ